MSEQRTEDRVIRVWPLHRSWLLSVDEEWDTMTEDERQMYIYDAAVDNGKINFGYEEAIKP